MRVRGKAAAERVQVARAEQARTPAGPTMRAADFDRHADPGVELAQLDHQIELLRRLVKTSDPGSEERADLLFRLADAYLTKKRILELQAGALYEPIHEATEAGAK